MNEDKIKQLEQTNKELEANVQALSTMNAQKMSEQFQADDEIDIKELWTNIWDGKWLIISIATVFVIASVLYALWLPNEYKSTVLLAPASSSSSSSLSKLAGQFGGLASLAGINIGSGGVEDKSILAMEIIKTWGFLETFIKDNNVEVEVFAAKGWSRTKNQLLIDSDIYDQSAQQWVRDFDAKKGQTAEPSSWELYEKIIDRINISQDKTSGLVNLSVEFYSPIIAKEWTDNLIKAINKHIQKQDRDDAVKNIKYLEEKILETNVTDMQSVFYQLIEEQTKTLMLAEVSDEYVFKTVSPAKIAEEKSKPKRVYIVLLGLILGSLLGVMWVFIRNSLMKNTL